MIIGLSGQKRSGKDTSANIIRKYYEDKGKTVEQFAFADPLKEAVRVIFFPDRERIEDSIKETPCKKFGDRTPRSMLQYLGDSCRSYDIDIFLKNMLTRIENSTANVKIITDIRYDNEAQLVKNIGGIIIKLNRQTNLDDKHASEQGITKDFYDFVVDNNKDIQTLKENILKCFTI